MQVLSVIISSTSAKLRSKDLAEQWPKESTNRIKTYNVTTDNLNPILSQIHSNTRGVIDVNCPDGINCTGESMTSAFDRILNILATRVGRNGTIGYKSVQKSEIKQQNFHLKLDDNLFKLKEKELKQAVNDKTENKNNKESKKYNNDNTIEMEIKNPTPTENVNVSNESEDEIEQSSEEKASTTNGVEYFVFGGNKIVALN